MTKPDSFPFTWMEYCVDQVGSANFVKFGLKVYWQVPLIPRVFFHRLVMPVSLTCSVLVCASIDNKVPTDAIVGGSVWHQTCLHRGLAVMYCKKEKLQDQLLFHKLCWQK